MANSINKVKYSLALSCSLYNNVQVLQLHEVLRLGCGWPPVPLMWLQCPGIFNGAGYGIGSRTGMAVSHVERYILGLTAKVYDVKRKA